jgi:hypothetical protein
MTSCNVGAIALRPSGNYQGSYIFLHLNTGRTMIRSNWSCIPMSSNVIERVKSLAGRDQMIDINHINDLDIETNESHTDMEELHTLNATPKSNIL